MDDNLILYLGDDEIVLPYKWEICGHCEGEGKSSAYLGAFTMEEMHDDPDFAEDYRSGAYDRPCEYCSGGKVKVTNLKKMSEEHRAAYGQQLLEEAADRQTERMERLMEGGWREEGWFGE